MILVDEYLGVGGGSLGAPGGVDGVQHLLLVLKDQGAIGTGEES